MFRVTTVPPVVNPVTDWLADATQLMGWFLRNPALQLAAVVVIVAGVVVGSWLQANHYPPARVAAARWTAWGVGVAVIPTFAARIGYYPMTWTVPWEATCQIGSINDWWTANSVLNLVLLVPLVVAVAALLQPRSPAAFLLTATVISLTTAAVIEAGQAVSGLGVCQDGDVVRNTMGACVAAVVAAGVRWWWPDPVLRHARRPSRVALGVSRTNCGGWVSGVVSPGRYLLWFRPRSLAAVASDGGREPKPEQDRS